MTRSFTTVCAALLDSGVEPSLLELEITESAVMHDAEKAAGILRYFREMGVKIAIDDFGTGYSSLSHLKRFPIDCLKIDRSYVAGIERDPNDLAIAVGTIALAHSLGMTLVAEGVETRSQFEILKHGKWNKDHAWGFGDCSSDQVCAAVKASVLSEECGEVARAGLDCKWVNLRRELVQVSAVAIAWLEALEPK